MNYSRRLCQTNSLIMALLIVLGSLSFGHAFTPVLKITDAPDVDTLYIGTPGNLTHQALTRLGVDVHVVSPSEFALRDVNLFGYKLIISGMDVGRDVLNSPYVRDRLLKAIQGGAVFIGFRQWDAGKDVWLPAPVELDGAFQVGQIIQPNHPVIQSPNKLSLADLQKIHGGSMYEPFVNLGDGWIPIIGGNKVLPWFVDQRGQPRFPNEMHYGLVELPYGQGRIILTQLIPEYDWNNNHGWNENAPGKRFFENLVTYGLAKGKVSTHYVTPPSIPGEYEPSLISVLNLKDRPTESVMGLDMWDVDTSGVFEVSWDDRDIVTFRHPNEPSTAGGYARLSRTFSLSRAESGERTLLSFYVSDDYLGGMDRYFEGSRQVGAFENRKKDHRFVEVAIDGKVIWEQDVLGANAYDWQDLFHVLDITEEVRGKEDIELSLAVVDRQESDTPFWTDVFISRVQVLSGVPGRTGEGIISVEASGDYIPAILVTDAPWQRGVLQVQHGETPVLNVEMSADNLLQHWVVGEPIRVVSGEEVTVELQPDKDIVEQERVEAAYLIPVSHISDAVQKVTDIRPWFVASELPDQISMKVEGPPGVGVLAPVTHGVPLAMGQIFVNRLGRVRLHDSKGHPVQLQLRPMAHWPDGSVKWLLLSFLGTPGDYTLILDDDLDDKTCRCEKPLVEQLDDSHFLINNGRLVMNLSFDRGMRVTEVVIDGKAMESTQIDLAMTYINGRRVSLADSEIYEIRLLENGSERSVLWVRGRYLQSDNPDLEFTFQWHVYRDQPFVLLDVAFTNRLGRQVELADIRLHFEGEYGQVLSVPESFPIGAVDHYSRPDTHHAILLSSDQSKGDKTSASWSLVQTNDRQFHVVDEHENVENHEKRFPGWVTLGSEKDHHSPVFFAGVRHFWEQNPKSVSVSPGGVEFGLWAKEAGRRLDVADGFQKTHQIVFGWIPEEEASHRASLLFQPYVLTVDPAYVRKTQVIGPFLEALPLREFLLGSFYDSSVARMYATYRQKRESRAEYGMQSFGDDTFEWGHGPVHTFWSNEEYDHQNGFLLQYLRARDPKFWQIGDQAARHNRDVVIIHHSTNPSHIGAPRTHNNKPVVQEGHYPDHNLGSVSVDHFWVEGLWLHYFLTGDELTAEAARGASDWLLETVRGYRWRAGGPERGPGWTLVGLVASYRATSDERYLEAAQTVAEDIYYHQDPVRGLYSVPISEQPSYEGGTSFMTGILGRGLARLYMETGDERAARATIRLYNWLTRESRFDDGRFLYKQSPNYRHPTTSNQEVSLLAYGLALSDASTDWTMVLNSTRLVADVRSLSWMPETLAIMKHLHEKYGR